MSKFFKVVFCSKCLEPGYKKIIKIEEKVKVSLNKEEIIRSKPIEDKMICKQCGNSSLIEIRGIKTEHIAEVIVFSVISNKYFKTANLKIKLILLIMKPKNLNNMNCKNWFEVVGWKKLVERLS